jgi:serine/threonine protein kinase/Flp pilus assembly protein TadD
LAIKCPTCHSDNPDTLKFCGECGTQLPPPPGHSSVMTETLQTPVRELTTGSTFAGRYQVIEELGHGGMGRVYKVHDTEIKEKVALKLLRPEITLDKEAVERFSNELKLARKISHRNVCRMFDLGRAEGTTFITMEFVPGEDLKSFLHRAKQLSIGTAVSIAKQVCEGLAEAHRLGVVHRDLKPGNIMIDKDGDAKIMDFGIARSLSGRGITGAGVLIGTPEYMSPEQVEGKDIDQRSDLYSLGVILYEMVTGRLPFAGDTPLSVAHKHKYEAPEDPKKLNAQVSDDLAGVILKCLAKDREKRYQSAAELGTELGREEQGLPTTDRIVRKRKALTSKEITVKFRLTKVLVPASVFIFLVLAGFVLWRVVLSRKPSLSPATSGQPSLVVLYFENKSGDPKLDNWRDGLTELLNEALQSRYIRVVSSDQLYTVLKRLGLADARKYSSEDIEKIAAQVRATHVLRGSYIKAGETFVITAGLQKPGTSESSTPIRLEANNDKDIIVKVNDLARQVKEGLDLTPAQIASDVENEAGKITTSSPEALKYYIEGRRLHEKGDMEQAIAYMEKAVEIDPEFAMAYRSMAAEHGNLEHDADFRKYYKKALELSSRLPENERLLIEGMSFFYDQNYAKAIETLERLVKSYPGHAIGHSCLGNAYGYGAGDFDKAIEQHEISIHIQRTPMEINNLVHFYWGKGLYQKAEDVCRSFLQDVEENGDVRNDLFLSYLCQRRFDQALAEAEKLYLLGNKWSKDPKWTVLFIKDDFAGAEKILADHEWQMRLLLAQGKINESIGLRQRNLEESKGDKGKEADAYGWLAGALEKAGRYEEAYRAFNQYLELSAENRKAAGESGPPYLPGQQKSDLFDKGRIQAEMKSFDEARKTAEELKFLINKGINKKDLRMYEYVFGLIELGKKNYRQAVDLFSRACGRLNCDDELAAFSFDPLARALYEAGDLDMARKEYEKITLLTTGRLDNGDIYARAYYMLGKIAEQQGDKPRAGQNYRKFLDLWKDADPGLPEVEDARKRLAGLS